MMRITADMLIVLLIFSVLIVIIPEPSSGYAYHEPIKIYSNADFSSQSWPGNGTETNPWLIEGLSISGYSSACMYLKDTTDHVVIQDSYLHDAEGYNRGAGIHLINTENVIIKQNRIDINTHGILIHNSRLAYIENNNITSSHNAGVEIVSSEDILCEGNNISNSVFYGFDLSYSRNITLRNNSLLNCGIFIDGDIYENSYDIDTSNQIDDMPVHYYSNVDGVLISENAGQVILVNVTNSTIRDLSFRDTEICISLLHSSNNRIINNNISGECHPGISLKHSDNNLIENNTFNGYKSVSLSCAIRDFYCNNNTIINNIIRHHSSGISFTFSANTLITGNIFENIQYCAIQIIRGDNNYIYDNVFVNVGDFSLSGTNYWDYNQIGNNWSDYSGIDEDGDGIGDTPYEIETSNWDAGNYQDRYPIVEPFFGVNDTNDGNLDIDDDDPLDAEETEDSSTPGFGFELIFLATIIAIIMYKKCK